MRMNANECVCFFFTDITVQCDRRVSKKKGVLVAKGHCKGVVGIGGVWFP